MKYLVTGGAGFIGSHIARRLVDGGHEVWVVDNLSTGKRQNIPDSGRFLEADISRADFVSALPRIRFDAVLHLAAQSSGEISHENPAYDLMTNAFGTLQLLRWCQDHSVPHFLYASSMAVYGLVDEFPVREDLKCEPSSFYGITKLAGEHYVRRFQSERLRTTVFRMFNVYGPGQNLVNMKQGMVSIYLAYVLAGEKLQVRGSKDRFRDFVYIDDVVDAWTAALNPPQSWGKTYNLGSGRQTYVWELIDELLVAFGHVAKTYPVEYGASTPGDQFGIYADISRIRHDLRWEPQTDLETGLSRMVRWARSDSSTTQTRG